MYRVASLAVVATLCGVLAACATDTAPPAVPGVTTPSTASTAPAGSTAPDGRPAGRPGVAPPASPLATEQRFLEDWFRGTPVVISAQVPAALQVDVPLANSFDAGKSDIKPALNAVLERVAESLRRQSGARITVTAPADANGVSATLSAQRTVRLREALVTKRVALPRVALGDAPRPGGPVQLRIFMPPPPIARLDDSALPVPAYGVKPVATTRAPITERAPAQPKRP
jgi:outer membrane protein OmpA-like peptidoglycan-associated protein